MNEVIRGSVLVVGGGIGGMQSALDLAESGFKVHLVQKEPSLGGTMSRLDKTFPTGDCAMCMLSPKLVEVGRHPDIVLHSLSEIVKIEGAPGNFAVTVKKHPRYVSEEKCTGCGLCEDKCPKKVPNEYEQGLCDRKAIYVLFPQAYPATRVIDKNACIYFQKGKCKACEKLCPVKAIEFDQSEQEFDVNVGAVILAPGLSRFEANLRGELGLGRWQNVVTSVQFERILSASGPYGGEVRRPSDGRHPEKIAWLQCVGSRDPFHNKPWCSSVCCMYATKQAIIAKEHDSNIKPSIFYMELRTYGKDFDHYVARGKNDYNVRYVRASVSAVREDPKTQDLILRYSQENGELIEERFSMVVLSVGFEPQKDISDLAKVLSVDLRQDGFVKTNTFSPIDTSRDGIYVTGLLQAPKDIPETVMQGSAVAGRAMALLGNARGTEVSVKELPPEKDINSDDTRMGVFICRCGINIAQTVDVQAVVEAIKDEPGVVYAEEIMYACAQDSQSRLKNIIADKNLNRVIVASCTPRTHAPLFQDTIRDAGLNRYLFELVDIREQCAWCHMGQNKEATKKAIALTKMSISKARLLAPIASETVSVTNTALIIGGGLAGMTAALSIAEQGYHAYLIEQGDRLGGLAREIHFSQDGSEVQKELDSLEKQIVSHKLITTFLNTEVIKTEGFVGNFKTTISDGKTLEHGAIIICSGGEIYVPDGEYLYGKHSKVITQKDLEERMLKDSVSPDKSYVMIQCVGSREDPHDYCSRVCCQDAIKNAIAIKKKYPNASVTILYRDIRTYGLREQYYEKARELGVVFIRFDIDRKPVVTETEDKLSVSAYDTVVNLPVTVMADWLILSVGLKPRKDADKISKLFKLTQNYDGFFLEAHVKLRPVDFASEGIYLAGLAHSPKNFDETVSQALAAAGRAGNLLSRKTLSVSGSVARHNRDICMSCLSCVRKCPYGAPFIDSDGRISHNEVKCVGCGVCAGICPAKAFQVSGFKDEQILSMIKAIAV